MRRVLGICCVVKRMLTQLKSRQSPLRRSSEGVLSVRLVGPGVATVCACAPAAYARGPGGASWCTELEDYAAIVMLAEGRVLSTPAMARYRA